MLQAATRRYSLLLAGRLPSSFACILGHILTLLGLTVAQRDFW